MQKQHAFSLVEVTLSIGIIAFALLSIFALIPVGMNSGREAIDATHTSLIAQDLQNRVRSSITSTMFSSATDVTLGPWFYNRDGVFVDVTAGYSTVIYRADVIVHGTWGVNPPPPNVDVNFLRPVTTQLHWPVNSTNGNLLPNVPAGANFTFHIRKP